MDDQQLARSILRAALTDGDASPADRIRAAQLLLATSAAQGASDDALQADDAELLRIARGDSPPQRGPAVPENFSVPSEAQRDTVVQCEDGSVLVGDRMAIPDSLGRVPLAELIKGTQKRTPNLPIPGGTPRDGTQKGTLHLPKGSKNAKTTVEPWE